MHFTASAVALASISTAVVAWQPYQPLYAREAALYEDDLYDGGLYAREASPYADHEELDLYQRDVDLDVRAHYRRGFMDAVLEPRLMRGFLAHKLIKQTDEILSQMDKLISQAESSSSMGGGMGSFLAAMEVNTITSLFASDVAPRVQTLQGLAASKTKLKPEVDPVVQKVLKMGERIKKLASKGESGAKARRSAPSLYRRTHPAAKKLGDELRALIKKLGGSVKETAAEVKKEE